MFNGGDERRTGLGRSVGEEEEDKETEKSEEGDEVDEPVGPARRRRQRRRRQAARLRGSVLFVGGGRGRGGGGGGGGRGKENILALGVVLDYKRLLLRSAMAVELRDRRAEGLPLHCGF